ncbi:DUF6059 family protein [Streptomyces sp. NPDC050619]|uniref:DUF6059 family protein n=1 Tax=Streptomyces sp. NPDC050619 TaxID=3157214 RepID=UPI003434D58C
MSGRLWSRIGRALRGAVPDWETLGLAWGAISIGSVALLPAPDRGPCPTPAPTDLVVGLPSGHPERAIPTVPLSEAERALWSQLS